MNSHDLAKQLLANPNVELIKQTDDEGNGYTPVSGVDFGIVAERDGYEYNVYSTDSLEADDLYMDEMEFEAFMANNKDRHAVIY